MTLIIRRGGNEPKLDGEVNVYVSTEVGAKSWFDTRKKVIFINGMLTSGKDHVERADALSTLLGCPVTGVYNKTESGLTDFAQCITDKIQFDAATVRTGRVFTFHDWKMIVDVALIAARTKVPSTSRVDFVRRLIEGNPATAALYDLLQAPGYEHSSVQIFAHSQGNLITSNALTALALAKGELAIEGRIVNSYGSPCRYWPERIIHKNNVFTFDPIGWLDYKLTFNSSKVGVSVSHDFKIYMEHDPEFVINRFRWGGYGMTFNMDEEGLANALVEMGPNPDRLYKIFKRLKDAHNADSDDVVVYYIRKLRKIGQEKVLRTMAAARKDLIELLITILDNGWTTSEERSFIETLQKMLK